MKPEVLDHYESIADDFTNVSNIYCNERYRKEIKKYVNEGDCLLDIGCGTGLLLSKLNGKLRVGCDLSSGLLSQRKDGKIHLIRADAENIPCIENYFDVVYSVNLLEHVPHPQKVVSEAVRVLKPGGTLMLITPNGDISIFLEILDRLKLKAPEGPHKFLKSKDMVTLAKRADCTLVKSRKFIMMPKGPSSILSFVEKAENSFSLGFFHLAVLKKT